MPNLEYTEPPLPASTRAVMSRIPIANRRRVRVPVVALCRMIISGEPRIGDPDPGLQRIDRGRAVHPDPVESREFAQRPQEDAEIRLPGGPELDIGFQFAAVEPDPVLGHRVAKPRQDDRIDRIGPVLYK